MKANFATFANALCHLNATPLSVAVLAPCAWSGNLATKRHSKASATNSVWRVFADKTTHGKFGLASVAKWAMLASEADKVKMEQCLGGGLLSLSR